MIDAAVVAPYCDGTILVMGDRNVRRTQMQGVVEQLEKSGSKILGVVRNNTKKSDRSYYYYKKKNYRYE